MKHRWINDPDGSEYCGRCGLLEWHAAADSRCSGEHGVADEVTR